MQPSTGTATALHTERGHSLRGVTTVLSPGTGPPAASGPSVLLAQRSLPPPRSPLSELSCNRQGPVGAAFGSSHRALAQARTRKPDDIMTRIRRLTQGSILLCPTGSRRVLAHQSARMQLVWVPCRRSQLDYQSADRPVQGLVPRWQPSPAPPSRLPPLALLRRRLSGLWPLKTEASWMHLRAATT